MELGGNAPAHRAARRRPRRRGRGCAAREDAQRRLGLHGGEPLLRAQLASTTSSSRRMAAELGRALRVGPGLDRDNDLGALVSVAERDKVAALVDGAVADGATRGARRRAVRRRAPSTTPTLLDRGRSTARRSTTTEIFGPVTAVVALRRRRRGGPRWRTTPSLRPDGLRLRRGARGHRRRPPARGRAWSPSTAACVSDPAAPFGGVKQSGLGREGSSEGILEFLEEQYIALTA